MLLFLLSLFACQPSMRWDEVVVNEESAFMGITGSADDDVWVTSASATGAGSLLHWDGEAWSSLNTGWPVDLWWAHAFGPQHAIVGGSGCTILEVRGDEVERFEVPGHAAETVFGVWGPSSGRLYAVGGRAGRDGFVWSREGRSWKDEVLPELPRLANGNAPSLFKVWGRSADDVWVVGDAGTILHFDGRSWALVPSGTSEPLYTITGDAQEVVIVGGNARGVVLAGGLDGFENYSPEGAQSLQAATFDAEGTLWIAGEPGDAWTGEAPNVWRRQNGRLVPVLEATTDQSIHAMWASPEGTLWTAGGNVLSPELDQGLVTRGSTFGSGLPAWELPETEPLSPPDCSDLYVDPVPHGSMARRWNEMILNFIRRDIPRPTVHARNLFHFSAAMYDAWATYDVEADGYFTGEKLAFDPDARDEAIAYAAYRMLAYRYRAAAGAAESMACANEFMEKLGYDPEFSEAEGDSGAALGNRIAATVIAATTDDGSNELNDYADITGWTPKNDPMFVERPGVSLRDRDDWQQLNLTTAETQNGILVEAGTQKYIGAHWGYVEGFATPEPDDRGITYDPGPPPNYDDPEMKSWIVDMIAKQAKLDPTFDATIDISPGRYGNNPLGSDAGPGHPQNPFTGGAYATQVVPLADFGRVLAEYWADGPKSETPPGHWNSIANTASDRLAPGDLRPFGGELVDRLTWDVQLYFALNGATHDAAIAAWGAKRAYTRIRPISLVRYAASLGQSSELYAADYHPDALPLVPGLIERVTEASSAPGERHEQLRNYIGEIAVMAWYGEPGDRRNEVGGVGWIRGVDWMPYQRRTFVSPAFPGFISGHSTFSRAAAEVLTAFTASPYYPTGIGQFTATPGNYLVFEDGPSVPIRLEWATYYDAADQAGQSRLWGGIHILPDDHAGRRVGHLAGVAAAEEARRWFKGTAVP
jgi:hypothetical protein